MEGVSKPSFKARRKKRKQKALYNGKNRKRGKINGTLKTILDYSISDMMKNSDDMALQGIERVHNSHKKAKRTIRYSKKMFSTINYVSKYGNRLIKEILSNLIKALLSKSAFFLMGAFLAGGILLIPIILGTGVVAPLFGWLYDISEDASETLTYYQNLINESIEEDTEKIDDYVNPSGDDVGGFSSGSDTSIDVNYKEVLAVLITKKIRESDDDSIELLEHSDAEIEDILTYFYEWSYTFEKKSRTERNYIGKDENGEPQYEKEVTHYKDYTVTLVNHDLETVMDTLNFDSDDRSKVEVVLDQLDSILIMNMPTSVEDYTTNSLGWAFPLPETSGWYISSGYGEREDPITGEDSFHSGVDITAVGISGDPIIAILNNGEVVAKGYNSVRGNYLEIQYDYQGSSYTVIYMHMIASRVDIGDGVNQGDVVGIVGSTGKSTGPHLHVGIKTSAYFDPWTVIDPDL